MGSKVSMQIFGQSFFNVEMPSEKWTPRDAEKIAFQSFNGWFAGENREPILLTRSYKMHNACSIKHYVGSDNNHL